MYGANSQCIRTISTVFSNQIHSVFGSNTLCIRWVNTFKTGHILAVPRWADTVEMGCRLASLRCVSLKIIHTQKTSATTPYVEKIEMFRHIALRTKNISNRHNTRKKKLPRPPQSKMKKKIKALDNQLRGALGEQNVMSSFVLMKVFIKNNFKWDIQIFCVPFVVCTESER